MRRPTQDGSSTPRVSTPPNAFDSAFLEQVQAEEEPLTAAEADLSGPWKLEALPPDAGWPGAFAVLRVWESLDRGDLPEAVFLHRETALLCAAALPLVEREPLFHLHDEPAAGAPLPGGHPVSSLYGEQGVVVRGWLRRFQPELVEALHLLEGLVRAPHHLADVGCAAGGGALHHLGRILAERLARADRIVEAAEPEE
jgi:hypothetical protein